MQTIYYGAPGTGKSHTIDTEILGSVSADRVFRVTFYPEFTYNDFIGQLLPKVIPSTVSGGASTITYDFQKGMFTLALEKAYENTSNDVYLVIEEMSRGDCAAIFGDIFQLLDREKSGVNKGYSKYFIDNELIAKDILSLKPASKVKLPPNFHILGTVNTSDQNVFVMDTAFKRRFEWEYISTKPVSGSAPGSYKNNVQLLINDGTTMKSIYWVDLYQKLNVFIADEKYLGLGEDKQLGPFFIEFDLSASSADHKKQIKNKLLHYLWSDVHKASYRNDMKLFKDSIGTFSELYDAFEADEQVFSAAFINIL
ncbi:AAA family ATPase [Dielma fastidiosa]|uniref:AAA family ATPase n=1 Tax=Dielma fastidiosa TaxID=1034346 RepID=A0AB35UQ27_9FIRM|nr:AAA family ATPase [Dielma fastidiosa]MDY5168214.1 AAA family ATPase [Dielma fastidiosa]